MILCRAVSIWTIFPTPQLLWEQKPAFVIAVRDATCVSLIFPVATNFSSCSFIFLLLTSQQTRALSCLVSANPREIAIQSLRHDQKNLGFVEEILNKQLSDSDLYKKDHSLARELTLGLVRWRRTLEWLAGRKLRTQPPETVLLVLMLGLYQLFWLDKIPLHAAVFETVELCRKLGIQNYKNLVNAILRAYTREMDATKELLAFLRKKNPALACSHPDWLYLRWKKQLGDEKALQMMDWDNSIPYPFLRVNTLKTTRETYLEKLTANSIEAEAVEFDFLDEQLMIRLPHSIPPHLLPGYEQGYFYVQDPAALLVVQLLNPQAGERVLDACAAPGGKTTYMAQRMKNEGSILALDILERLDLIEENVKRMGFSIVQVQAIREFQKAPRTASFDRVLLDVPCSNTGVLRRRVEARYRLNIKELEVLKQTQASLLQDVAPLTKTGGRIAYSTCSIDQEENEKQIKTFLATHPEFQLEKTKQLLPCDTHTDGAFVAILLKNK